MLTVEQIAAAQQAQLNTLFGFGAKAVESAEKVIELNLQASKALLADSAEYTKSLLSAKDAQEFLKVQTGFVQPLAEKSAAYGRRLYDIAAGANAEFTQAAEAQTASAQKQFASAVEAAVKNVPQGGEAAVAAIKNAMTGANSAFEQVQKVVKQATEVAESNFKAVTATATKAAKAK